MKASGLDVALRFTFVGALLTVLAIGPASQGDWTAVAIVTVVALVLTSVVWLWALSDLTGGWYG